MFCDGVVKPHFCASLENEYVHIINVIAGLWLLKNAINFLFARVILFISYPNLWCLFFLDNIATYAASLKIKRLPENQRVIFVNDGDKRNTSCVQLSSQAPSIQIEFGESYVIASIIITFRG